MVGSRMAREPRPAALARFSTRCFHLGEKKSRRFNRLEQILMAEPVSASAGFGLKAFSAQQREGEIGEDAEGDERTQYVVDGHGRL
jgi:hypothetical protein